MLSTGKRMSIADDPVRPELSLDFRLSHGREIYTTFNAVVCVAYCDDIPAEVSDLNSGRGGLAGTGTKTAALAAGGNGPSALVESWNGSSWTEVGDLSVVKFAFAQGSGTNTDALLAGGATPGGSPTGEVTTEEWTVPSTVTNTTITD